MSAYSDIFERKEQKYVVRTDTCQTLLDSIADRVAPDEYAATCVRSLYYDTPSFDLIEKSLDKPVYKEKLRLRSYGCPNEEDQVYVELKKKYKGIVYKRRIALSYKAALEYLAGTPYRQACLSYPLTDPVAHEQSLSAKSLLIAREIDIFRKRNGPLAPTMLITCEREAFVAVDDADLRITVDRNLEYVLGARDLEPQTGERLLQPGEAVLELKSIKVLPLWLVRELTKLEVYPRSFSKYGNAYLATSDAASASCAEIRWSAMSSFPAEELRAPIPLIERSLTYA